MSPTVTALLGYISLMLALLVTLGLLRAGLAFAGKRAPNSFAPDGADVSPFSNRLCRARNKPSVTSNASINDMYPRSARTVPLQYAGKTSEFSGSAELKGKGPFEAIVYAYNPENGNTGIDVVKFNAPQ